MADRRRQIELLIATRFDHLWFPGGSLRTQPGLAPSARVACPDCGHTDHPGWTVDSFKRRTPCGTCGGHVTKTGKPRAGKGRIAVDAMDAERKPVGSSDTSASARPRRTVSCDACAGEGATTRGRCARCEGTGRRDLHVFDLHVDVREEGGLDALTSSIVRRDQAGSYHELDLALAGVARHVNKPLEFRVVTDHAVQALRLLDELYLPPVSRELIGLSGFELGLLDLTMRYLDSRMPDPIRVPGDVIQNRRLLANRPQYVKGGALNDHQRKARDKQIRQWEREGKPRSWIAGQTGLNDRQLREIINGAKSAA